MIQPRLFFLGSSRYGSGLAPVLLLRLVLAGEAGCRRDALAASFWPGDDLPAARARLRQVLLLARRALAFAGIDPAVIRSDRMAIYLAVSEITTDIGEFQDALKRGDWEQADMLYTGDLLPSATDAVIAVERECLRMAHRDALRRCVALCERDGALLSALQSAARQATLEPMDADAGLRLVRLMLRAGHLQAARDQYRTLKRALSAEGYESLSPVQQSEVRQWFAEAARTGGDISFPGPIVPASAHALPPTRNRFFGRTKERGELSHLLRMKKNRLVTLIGPAGSGKTRLALEIAERITDEREPFFVGLADITEQYQFGGKVIRALNVARNPALPPLEQIVSVLNATEKPPLLLLDNVEHLLSRGEICRDIAALLAGVPALLCLATSRQPLEIAGETVFPVEPLPLPVWDDSSAATLERLMASPAVALFIDRIQAVRPEFRLSARNASSITTLCRQLDGLPLALEIVATWAKTLTPAQMLSQLAGAERRRALLTSRRPRASDSARHASLQAAIDWSFCRLSPNLQTFFARLHIFRGGFTIEAAATVCDEPRAPEFLSALQERSFLQMTEKTGPGGQPMPRFRLLETLREFGSEQISDDENDRLCRRHASYYVALAERAETEMLRPDQIAWNGLLREEIDNFRAVTNACRASVLPVSLGLRLGGALWRFFSMSHYVREGRELLLALMELVPPSADSLPGYAKALFTLSNLAFYQGDAEEGIRYARACLRTAPLPEDAWIRAFAQTWLGVMLFLCGRFDDARRELALGLKESRVVGEDWLVGYALMQSALFAFFTGSNDNVRHYCEESLVRVDRLQEKVLAGLNYLVLGLYSFYARGDSTDAEAWCCRSLANFQATDDIWVGTLVRCQYAFVLTREGRLSEAQVLHREAVSGSEKLGDPHGLAQALEGLGEIAAQEGDFIRAALLWGAAGEHRRQIPIPLWPFLRPFRDAAVARTRAALGEPLFHETEERGRLMPLSALLTHENKASH